MLVIATVLLVVLVASVLGVKRAGGAPRWPFVAAATLAGSAVLAVLIGMAIALAAGRDTWNSWVSGSQLSQTVTLWVLLVVGPVLLSACCVLLTIGAVLRARQGRRSQQASSPT